MVCHINNVKVIEVHRIDSNSRYLSGPRYHVESFIPYAPVVRTWRKICFPVTVWQIPYPNSRGSSLVHKSSNSKDCWYEYYFRPDHQSWLSGYRSRSNLSKNKAPENNAGYGNVWGKFIVAGETLLLGDSLVKSDYIDIELEKRTKVIGCSFFLFRGTGRLLQWVLWWMRRVESRKSEYTMLAFCHFWSLVTTKANVRLWRMREDLVLGRASNHTYGDTTWTFSGWRIHSFSLFVLMIVCKKRKWVVQWKWMRNIVIPCFQFALSFLYNNFSEKSRPLNMKALDRRLSFLQLRKTVKSYTYKWLNKISHSASKHEFQIPNSALQKSKSCV